MKSYIRGLQLAGRGPNLAREGHTSGPPYSANMLKKNYYIFFKIHFSASIIYIFIFIIKEILVLVKFSSAMQDAVYLL